MEFLFDIPKWVLVPAVVIFIYIIAILGRDDGEENKKTKKVNTEKLEENRASKEQIKAEKYEEWFRTESSIVLDEVISQVINDSENQGALSVDTYRNAAVDKLVMHLDYPTAKSKICQKK